MIRRLPLPALTERQLFFVLALLIGAFSGLAVVCFRIAIEWSRLTLLGSALTPPGRRLLIVLPVAGLIVAALVELVFPRARGSGVNQTKAAVYIYDGYIPFRTVVGKFLTSALAIGSGQSLGPEDPSLQIGAGLASVFGRSAGLTRSTLRLIAPVGAAAGLAAAFNSPITAVLFVIEEVIGTWSATALGAVVLAAVSSVVVEQLFLGDQPLFRVPPYHLAQRSELIVYAILGVAGGLLSLLFVKLALFLRPRLRTLPRWTWFLQPACAGLIVAIVALRFPQITGAGYEYIDEAMHDQYAWQVLAALTVLKIFATVACFSSGTPGGLFAPALFIGAMLGGAVAGATHAAWPAFAGTTGVYALVGMGTMFAGILRAPITAVFMIIEVSGNYSIVVPVMISSTIAYLLARKYQHEGIFEVLSHQEGVTLPSMEHQREKRDLRVEDAMREAAMPVRPEDAVELALSRADGTEVLAEARPGTWTFLPADTLRTLVEQGKGELAVRTVAGLATALPTVYPDQSLDVALRSLGDRPYLPVVHRADHRRLVGIIGLTEILDAYRR